MIKRLLFLTLFMFAITGYAQELKCRVEVNADLVSQTNQQVFKTLERALADFLNQTAWTELSLDEHEKIEMDLFISVTAYENDQFSASLQIQSYRPIYNSTYQSSLLNFKDDNFNFKYVEFQPLIFNANAFESNLVSLLSFYVYYALGMDADSFAPLGGTNYFEKAQQIAGLAQQSGFTGWSPSDGRRNRYWLAENVLSNTFQELRSVNYQYHRNGMDVMHSNPLEAKQVMAQSLMTFTDLDRRRPGAFLTQTFFEAKADEIFQTFSAGPKVPVKDLVAMLNKVAPFFSSKWNNIRF